MEAMMAMWSAEKLLPTKDVYSLCSFFSLSLLYVGIEACLELLGLIPQVAC